MSLSRRSGRPRRATSPARIGLENLEGRQLLSAYYGNQDTSINGNKYHYTVTPTIPQPDVFASRNEFNPADVSISLNPGTIPVETQLHPIGIGNATLAGLGNEGKSISGRDRNGNLYTITVHGPGEVIVTDATPGDGVLDDDIDTIQLVGTDPNTTTVIGQVTASAAVGTNPIPGLIAPSPATTTQSTQAGAVFFNKLIAQQGVKSIILNGFILTQTVVPPNGGLPNSNTGIYLAGGARNLEFTGVSATVDQSTSGVPINIVDGDPSVPLSFKPSVRIDEITNTVFDSTATIAPTTPQTLPTLNIIINAESGNLQFASITQATEPAALQYLYPTVGTTGRTSIQTKGIDNIRVAGSAINTTFARTAQPFSSATSGLSHVGSAQFGGNADALAINSRGKIGTLRFNRGLGNPAGTTTATTNLGSNVALDGYPANGLLGGLVSGSSIGSVTAGPGDVTQLTSTNPANLQSLPKFTRYYPKAGRALSNAAIVSAGNINAVNVVGDSTNSEIKSGFSLTSYNQGLEGTRAASAIKHLRIRGDLVNSVVSASYRPAATGYGTPGSVVGAGSISGTFNGTTATTYRTTALGNLGSGFYARAKSKGLPAGA